MKWHEIAPEDATGIDCTQRPDLGPPRNREGRACPWPWEPQRLQGGGLYTCPWCGAGVLAGVQHPDYGSGQSWDDESFMGPLL